MNIPDRHQARCLQTWIDEKRPLTEHLTHMALGLASETGEFVGLIDKLQFKPSKEVTRSMMLDELGDVLYYVTIAAYLLGVTVEELYAMNAAKLQGGHGWVQDDTNEARKKLHDEVDKFIDTEVDKLVNGEGDKVPVGFLKPKDYMGGNDIAKETRYPWHKAPDWAQWAATDADGEAYWFNSNPIPGGGISGRVWVFRASVNSPVYELIGNDFPADDWQNSLEARPS